MNGKRQVRARTLPSQGSGTSASVKLGTGGATAATLKSTTASQGVAGPSRQPIPPLAQRWSSDTLSTPRRMVSEPATPPKESVTPSRTNSATWITQVMPATRGLAQPVMSPPLSRPKWRGLHYGSIRWIEGSTTHVHYLQGGR